MYIRSYIEREIHDEPLYLGLVRWFSEGHSVHTLAQRERERSMMNPFTWVLFIGSPRATAYIRSYTERESIPLPGSCSLVLRGPQRTYAHTQRERSMLHLFTWVLFIGSPRATAYIRSYTEREIHVASLYLGLVHWFSQGRSVHTLVQRERGRERERSMMHLFTWVLFIGSPRATAYIRSYREREGERERDPCCISLPGSCSLVLRGLQHTYARTHCRHSSQAQICGQSQAYPQRQLEPLHQACQHELNENYDRGLQAQEYKNNFYTIELKNKEIGNSKTH